jgi:hypothetical protein
LLAERLLHRKKAAVGSELESILDQSYADDLKDRLEMLGEDKEPATRVLRTLAQANTSLTIDELMNALSLEGIQVSDRAQFEALMEKVSGFLSASETPSTDELAYRLAHVSIRDAILDNQL